MEDLTFYRKLKAQLETNGQACTDIHIEVCNRLNKLKVKESVNKWDKLCDLIEDTAKKYERENKELVDITVEYEDNIITITNNLYSEF